MTAKKQRERSLLNEFKSIYSDFPSGQIIEFEEPDFLVPTEMGIIGIELVDYVRGQSKNGSVLRRDEKLRERIANEAKAEFEAKHQTPLMVQIHWYGHRHLSKADVRLLASSAAELIEKCVPPEIFDMVRVGRERLAGTPLERFVPFIHVTRVRTAEQSSWSSTESGWIEVFVEELEELISLKDAKIDAYLQNCAIPWLIIVADRGHISSSVALPDTVKQYPFQTRFDRVIFWNRLNQSVITLADRK
jgi:hypothetical protein